MRGVRLTPALIFLWAAFSGSCVIAQGSLSYERTDSLVTLYSKRSGRSSDSLVSFVKSTFPDDAQKVRAFYTWIALNISYDKELLDNYKAGSDLIKGQYWTGGLSQQADTVLFHGKAVCEGNCLLLNFLCEKAGITSVMVPGITRLPAGEAGLPEGEVAESVLHTWNAVLVNSSWRLLDVTWAAGYVNGNDKYIKRFTGGFFFTEPASFVTTHWPLDAMFQLLDVPLSKQDFYASSPSGTMGNFNFGDSITDFLKQKKTQREYLSLLHYHRYDPDNRIYRDGLDHFIYNRAATTFNKAALYFDDYYDFAKTLKGRNIGLQEVNKCLRLLAEPKKYLEDGLVYAHGQRFFDKGIKHRFDQMVQSSSKKLVSVNDLIASYEKMQGSLK